MKKVFLLILISIVLCGSFANGGNEEKEVKKIKVGTEGTYSPYSYHDESGELTGYDVEVIKAIADEIGYEVEFVESRWDGLLAGLKTNRWDIVANQVWWNEARAQDYLLSDKYLVAGAAVLVRTDNPATKSTDLQDQTAATSLTSAFRPYVEELTPNLEFQDDFNLAVDLLISKRVDFLVNDIQTIAVYVKNNPDKNLKIISLDGAKTTDVVLAINKENNELLEKVNQALETLEGNGSLQKIKDKYFAN